MARSALALRDGPLLVVGHSLGARVAMEAVRLAPERVEKLVLMDTGVSPRREGEEASRQVLLDLADEKGMAALADRWLPPMVHEAHVDDAVSWTRCVRWCSAPRPAQHHRQIKALLDRPDARPLLPAIKCPTLVMVGRQDRWSPLAQHEEMAGCHPRSRTARHRGQRPHGPVEQPEQVTAGPAIMARACSGTGCGGRRTVMADGPDSRDPALRPQEVAARLPDQQDGDGPRQAREPGGVPR